MEIEHVVWTKPPHEGEVFGLLYIQITFHERLKMATIVAFGNFVYGDDGKNTADLGVLGIHSADTIDGAAGLNLIKVGTIAEDSHADPT